MNTSSTFSVRHSFLCLIEITLLAQSMPDCHSQVSKCVGTLLPVSHVLADYSVPMGCAVNLSRILSVHASLCPVHTSARR
ncbi:hypothetical protein B0T21DRAFT_367637 [Apiosordaria backusii]|uniref:Secreted protein n=1 Tax=Apiosordaria backusii TaxID=314023 RepID=A0AA40BJG9_9PEZI|nr:hypothetical protein B0T21DRAFT_367637 [Apiosordaria backusii]